MNRDDDARRSGEAPGQGARTGAGGSSARRSLFIVQEDFLSAHVGVRRVILHYARAAMAAGDVVTFATPDGRGRLRAGHSTLQGEAPTGDASAPGPAEAAWTSADRVFRPGAGAQAAVAHQRIPIAWTGSLLRPGDFDRSVLTAPWLCHRPLPPTPCLSGIVYDMVPNLLSLGILRMPLFADVYGFAHDHQLGYQHLLDHAARILCISDATRRDFLALTGPSGRGRTVVDIPYAAPSRAATPGASRRRRGVLMVNAFDPRKNIANAALALLGLARRAWPEGLPAVRIVGRERMPLDQVLGTLGMLADAGLDVRWHRDVDDPQLARLYGEAGVLLFPSLYEGLGLPILEAQAAGLPVVSSNISSCPEINLNPALSVSAESPDEIEAALAAVLEGRAPLLSGPALRDALDGLLARVSDPSALWAP